MSSFNLPVMLANASTYLGARHPALIPTTVGAGVRQHDDEGLV